MGETATIRFERKVGQVNFGNECHDIKMSSDTVVTQEDIPVVLGILILF